MKARSVFLTIFLTVCFSTIAQVDDFQEKIISCLQINGTKTIYDKEYGNVIYILSKQFNTTKAPESFWEELRSDRIKKVEELMSNLAFAYRKHFSEDDIDSMDVFFRMEAAQIWLESPDQLNELQKNKVNAFLESDTGKKIVSKDKALRKDMDEIASHWKRELFAEKMSTLIRSGYIPH